jgi:formate/nitrite transporter FocA (FNT family)
MATSQNPEKLYQPQSKTMIGAAVVGAVLGMGAIAGLAAAADLTGQFWLFLGLILGAGWGVSLSVILPQLRYNSSL